MMLNERKLKYGNMRDFTDYANETGHDTKVWGGEKTKDITEKEEKKKARKKERKYYLHLLFLFDFVRKKE